MNINKEKYNFNIVVYLDIPYIVLADIKTHHEKK